MAQLTAYDKFIQQALKYGFSLWGIPKTGQQTTYNAGDDGQYRKGYPRAGGVRFVDNRDGTITDNATGLMWIKDPIAAPGAPFHQVSYWVSALANCEALNFAGHTDWRLPNIRELTSISDFGKDTPAIDEVFFPNPAATRYWSGSTVKGNTTYAFAVETNTGKMIELRKTPPTPPAWTRPVRLGVPA